MDKMVSASTPEDQGKIPAFPRINRDFLANLIAAQIDQSDGTAFDSAQVAIEVLEGLGLIVPDRLATGQSDAPAAAISA